MTRLSIADLPAALATRPWSARACVRAQLVVVALSLGLGPGCSDPPPPADPPPQRFAVETLGYQAWRTPPPPKGIAWWRRADTVVQHDERDADRLPSGGVLERNVPAGARALETALGAWMAPQYWIERDRSVRLVLELAEGGARRPLVDETLSVHALLAGGWRRYRLELTPPAERGARLLARVELAPAPPVAPGERDESGAEIEFALERPWVAPAEHAQPNVLVLSIDTLRADHLGCYGYSRPTSPRIDALAARGVLFENCVAPAPWTLPSYGSLFTSRSPIVHRAGVNPPREAAWGADRDVPEEIAFEDLRRDLPTWAELLRARGYATAGFHSNPFLRAGTGIERGFQRWTWYWPRASAAVELASEWIRARERGAWFAFVHLMDPHQPYAPPPPWDTKWSSRVPEAIEGFPLRVDDVRARTTDEAFRADYVGLYDGEIGYTDEQIGRLLDDLERAGVLANTIVVLHSDHGEEFWEHGGYEHGHALVEEVIHVPLLVVWPGHVPAGVRVADRVSLLDVMPTVLALANVPRPTRIEGVDLAPTWAGRALGARALLSDTMLYGPRETKALFAGAEKLVVASGRAPRLHDLALDPREQRDVAAERPEAVRALVKRLTDRIGALNTESKRSGLSNFDGVREVLGTTGYAGFETSPRDAKTPPPKDATPNGAPAHAPGSSPSTPPNTTPNTTPNTAPNTAPNGGAPR